MSIEGHLDKYPNIKASFNDWMQKHPDVTSIQYDRENPHPLFALVVDECSRTQEIANRTDWCFGIVKKKNSSWLESKVKKIITDKNMGNVSATLGEIRAYGELVFVWNDAIKANSSGNDFSFKAQNTEVKVEVHTPQHRSQRRVIKHKSLDIDCIKSSVLEIYSFGYPEKNIDNVQGEATSKLGGIKDKEHQWDAKSINILWIDLKDPILWPLELWRDQSLSVSQFNEDITSGAFWCAFYGKRNTYIYDNLSVSGILSTTYAMEYNGRFWNDSLIDFVIADTPTDKIVFQNLNRKDIYIPDELFQKIHHLFAFNLELSWLDWPLRNSLTRRIETQLEIIQSYKDAFSRKM